MLAKVQNKKLSLIAGGNGKSAATVETNLALLIILSIALPNDPTTMFLNTNPSELKTYILPKLHMDV